MELRGKFKKNIKKPFFYSAVLEYSHQAYFFSVCCHMNHWSKLFQANFVQIEEIILKLLRKEPLIFSALLQIFDLAHLVRVCLLTWMNQSNSNLSKSNLLFSSYYENKKSLFYSSFFQISDQVHFYLQNIWKNTSNLYLTFPWATVLILGLWVKSWTMQTKIKLCER